MCDPVLLGDCGKLFSLLEEIEECLLLQSGLPTAYYDRKGQNEDNPSSVIVGMVEHTYGKDLVMILLSS